MSVVLEQEGEWGRGTIENNLDLHQSVCEDSSQFKFDWRNKDSDITPPGTPEQHESHSTFSYCVTKTSSGSETIKKVKQTSSPILQVRR